MFVILGGAGKQGRAICRWLLRHTKKDVVVVDITCPPQPYFNYHWFPAERPLHVRSTMLPTQPGDVLISCLEPEENLKWVLPMALEKSLHYIDLGGDTEIAVEQRALAHQHKAANQKLCIVPDCGVAPGIVSTLAGSFERDGMTHVFIECGGVAKDREMNYVRSFGVNGLLREYSGLAQLLINGQIVERNVTLSDKDWSCFPVLDFEKAITSGGLSVSPSISKLKGLTYRTLRWSGHYSKLIGKGYAERQTQLLGYPEVSTDNPDMLVLAVKAFAPQRRIVTIYKWDYDHKNGISAMAQATGYSVAATANLIDQGKQPYYGFIPMYDFEIADIMDELYEEPGQMKLIQGSCIDNLELEGCQDFMRAQEER